MNIVESKKLSFFFNPKSVAVIGASDRPGSWGNKISEGLLFSGYTGDVYLVNPSPREVLGRPSYPGLDQVPGEVELAIIVISADRIWDALNDCNRKGVKGIVIITSGFGEALGEKGKRVEEEMALFARRHGIRIIGPNVSGIYNLHANFYAAGSIPPPVTPSNMSFLCQGGFAVHNIVSSAYHKGIVLGKFLHTGNEADIQCIDFLDFLGQDPDTEVILMYIEGLKEPTSFLKIAGRITPKKPIILYKGGRNEAGNRAAASHTGVLAGSFELYRGLFKQAGCILAPTFETMLELGHAFTFYPPLRGARVGIITQGGSWGVMLTDHLSQKGFYVSELPSSLQKTLRDFGMPYRASTRNPVDFGAAGLSLDHEVRLSILEALLSSEKIDAVIFHGYGLPGMESDSLPGWVAERQKDEEELLRKGMELMRIYQKPLLIGSYISHFESVTIQNLVRDGIPVFNRLADIADILWSMYLHHQRLQS